MSSTDQENYYVRRDSGSRIHGPLTAENLRSLIHRGEVSRFHEVSADDCVSWQRASAFPDLWETTALIPVSQAPDYAYPNNFQPTPAPPTTVQQPQYPPNAFGTDSVTIPHPITVSQTAPPLALPALTSPPLPTNGSFGLALAGFITGTAALTFAFIPLSIWAFQYTRAYWLIPVVFPIFVASVTGLVLSTVAFSRKRTGFATTGLVVGICASVISLTTSIGWLVTSDPTTRWIYTLTAQAEADVALARVNFLNSLNRYRDSNPVDDSSQLLTSMTVDLMTLSKAHARLLTSSSSTPRFRQHFGNVDDLRMRFEQFREAISARDGVLPSDAIASIGQSPETLKLLLDLLSLYQTGQITIETAQSKFR